MPGSRRCNLELINSCLQYKCEYCVRGVCLTAAEHECLSHGAELEVSHATIMKNVLRRDQRYDSSRSAVKHD